MLARVGAAESLIADLRTGRTGALSIAYFASVGAAWMPLVVRRILTELPGVRLDLQLREHIPDSREERADVQVVVAGSGFDPGSGFTAHHLLDDPYVAVVPAGHRLADRQETDLADLADERWIDNDVARGWCRTNLLEACTAAGFSPAFRVEAHDYRTALAFVAAGIGLTVLPALGAADVPDGVARVRLVRPTPTRSVHVVVHDAVEHTPAARMAVAALRDAAHPAHAR